MIALVPDRVATNGARPVRVLPPLPPGVWARRPVEELPWAVFGSPRRAWEFVGPANARDRPALALPIAQSVPTVRITRLRDRDQVAWRRWPSASSSVIA